MGLVLLALVVVIALWLIAVYNGLIALKNQVVNAWKQIDVQLKRRHDLIPNRNPTPSRGRDGASSAPRSRR